MISGGEPITIITSILGMVGAIASFAATENPLAALGMLGPATGMIGSAVAPALSAATSTIPGAVEAGTLGAEIAPGMALAGGGGLLAGPTSAASTALNIGSPSLSALNAVGPAATAASSITPVLSTAADALQPLAATTGNYNTPGGGAATSQAQGRVGATLPPAPDTIGKTTPGPLGGEGQQLVGPAPTKVPFAKRAGEFLWGKAPDPKMFGDDPQGKMLAAIMQMQYENQKGAMQRGLLGGGLKGLASMTSGLLEDEEYKPNYGYRSKKRMVTPRESYQRGNLSLGNTPSHSDLLKRIGFKTNA